MFMCDFRLCHPYPLLEALLSRYAQVQVDSDQQSDRDHEEREHVCDGGAQGLGQQVGGSEDDDQGRHAKETEHEEGERFGLHIPVHALDLKATHDEEQVEEGAWKVAEIGSDEESIGKSVIYVGVFDPSG